MFQLIKTKTYLKSVKRYQSAISRDRIDEIEEEIAKNPTSGVHITFIIGSGNRYRYRVGNYRIFYSVFEDDVEILLIEVKPRGGAYKKK